MGFIANFLEIIKWKIFYKNRPTFVKVTKECIGAAFDSLCTYIDTLHCVSEKFTLFISAITFPTINQFK